MRNSLLSFVLYLQMRAAYAQVAGSGQGRLFFAFGDSYADVGNVPRLGVSWSLPYGSSWPGVPTGRFSNGRVKTDILASEVLGVPSPPTYVQYTANTSISTTGGLNFAVGGSGVMQAFGTPRLAEQVEWFSSCIESGLFGSDALEKAVVFVSVSGNDYGSSGNRTLEDYLQLVNQVVELMDISLRRLHSLGVKHFMVSNLAPLNCLPARALSTGYASCLDNSVVEQVVSAHNSLLGSRLKTLMSNLTGSDFIYLQQTKAFSQIASNPSASGLTEGFRPCCSGFCGVVDSDGAPLYTVCDDPEKSMFWDLIHPTQAGWRAVVDLYKKAGDFTQFAPSLLDWINRLPIVADSPFERS